MAGGWSLISVLYFALFISLFLQCIKTVKAVAKWLPKLCKEMDERKLKRKIKNTRAVIQRYLRAQK